MVIPVVVLEKKKDDGGADWKGLEIGAIAKLWRDVNGWARVDLPDRPPLIFPRDDEAFDALARNGFSLMPESALSVRFLCKDELPEKFRQLIPET